LNRTHDRFIDSSTS